MTFQFLETFKGLMPLETKLLDPSCHTVQDTVLRASVMHALNNQIQKSSVQEEEAEEVLCRELARCGCRKHNKQPLQDSPLTSIKTWVEYWGKCASFCQRSLVLRREICSFKKSSLNARHRMVAKLPLPNDAAAKCSSRLGRESVQSCTLSQRKGPRRWWRQVHCEFRP